jgi:hypothetical protein
VPVVTAGAGESLLVLSDGHRLTELLRLLRLLRVHTRPGLPVAVPAGLGFGVMAVAVRYLPFPTRLETAALEAVAPASGQTAEALASRVQSRMQEAMDQLTRGRRWLLGRPARNRAALIGRIQAQTSTVTSSHRDHLLLLLGDEQLPHGVAVPAAKRHNVRGLDSRGRLPFEGSNAAVSHDRSAAGSPHDRGRLPGGRRPSIEQLAAASTAPCSGRPRWPALVTSPSAL